jgi:hypothetical protein
MAGALAKALAARQQKMRANDSDEEGGNDDEWVCGGE